MLLLRGKTGMYQTSKNSMLTAGAGLAPNRTIRSSTGIGEARMGSMSSNVRQTAETRPRFGLTHVLNTLRYVLFGTGAYEPPIGKFNV